jgi:hypothetical protein
METAISARSSGFASLCRALPLAVEGWSRVAHALGDAVGPILAFLKQL